MTSWRIGLALWLWLSGFGVVWAQRDLTNIPDPDPELERQTFLVPDGLEVSLFAADPALAKPIHMNFDERGRLWIASSELYPHIKPGEVANDKILILEDTDLDGRADKTTVFADGLLIPTGVAPGDGGAYVANSTELLHLRDTDGDGRADERRIILSGFGTEDTHHLLHTLRWGFDGCLYMNQSIYIHSHVETPFGVKRLNGGGIWRFRPETMQLDVLCYGFVNSWGHHFDDWGQSFATDGAYHEGINYVFPGAVFVSAPGAKRLVSGLNPGSPKHCGLEIVSGDHFPSDWSGSMITSDFRAHRVCRFVVTEDGSGYASRQETEVIKSTHVAFRPIDAKLGPRGDLFVADWYNPIIQHGEVDFRDPRRDHVHGRIWRVTAKGRPLQPIPDFQGATDAQLLDLLHATQESTRLHAKLTLKQRALQSDSRRQRIINAARQELAQLDRQSATFEHDRLEVLWLLQNVGEVDASLVTECARSADHRVRAAALRVAGEWLPELPDAWELFRAAATDGHPRVRLEAVRGLARFPEPRSASAALAALDQPLDRFLDFALWQTLRDLEPHWLPALTSGKLPWGDRADHWLFALRAIDSPAAVPPLLERIRQNQLPSEYGTQALSLIATHGGPNELATVLSSLFDPAAGRRAESRRSLLEAMVETSRARKVRPSGDLSQLKDLLADGDESLQSAALRAAGAWRVESLRTDAAELATRSTASEPLRRAAIEALAAMGGEPSIRLLMDISASDSALSVRAFAASSLAPLAIQRAAQRGVDLLQHWPGQIDPAPVLGGVLAQRSGPTALVAALKGKKLAPDVAKLAIRAVQTSNQPVPELIESLRLAGDLGASSWAWSPELAQQLVAAVASEGNAARGEEIYRRTEMQCLKCHAIAGAGGRVGPDLASIGATVQVDYLVESLLAPNAKIKENFHSKLITTDSGQVITGIPVRESKSEIVLRDAEDREITVPTASIDEKVDGRSLMPDGVADQLTRSELIDLIRFLSELGKVGDYFVGNSTVVRRWEQLLWTQAANQRLNRTSHDTAATNDPALNWQSVYSRVSGELPLGGLPRFRPHATTDPTSFVRCAFEVTTPGKLRLRLNDIEGLSAWLDGKPMAVESEVAWELGRGTHTLTIDINHARRQAPLHVELLPSEAQAQIVSGK